REATVGLQRPVPEKLGRQWPGVGIGNDLIVVAVHHEHRYGDLLQVFGEIGLGEGDDAVVVRLRAAHHALAPPVIDDGLRRFRARAVVTIKWSRREVAVKLRATGRDLCLQSIEYFLGKAAWISLGL